MLLSSCLLFYMCCFLIRLFAVWRYTGRIFNAGICRGKAISEFRSPKALPLHPHPLGHGRSSALLCVLRCWLLSVCCGTQNGTLCRSGFCILRYLWWYAVPICDLVLGFFGTYSGTLGRSGPCILRYLWWYAGPICSLYSSIFMVIRWADPVSVFFDTYRNILYQSDISGQDAQSASIPRMFFPVDWKRQPEEGGIGPGCCGGGVITTWAAGDGVIAAGSAVWAAGEFWPYRNAFSRLTEP